MSHPSVSRVGDILNADIAVPEHDREMRFYSRVLTTGETPLWREDLMNNSGTPIIGLGQRNSDYVHLPIQWMPHIQVADVAVSAERALELGGSELMHGKDDHGKSEWAVLMDTNGAAFGIIPVVSAEADTPRDGSSTREGRISWLNLTVFDASATCGFYREVINWSVQNVEVESAHQNYVDFNMAGENGSPLARIRHARGVNIGLPPVWMIHLPVNDIAESVRRVHQEGGEVINATQEGDEEFARVVVKDPVGAFFTLVPG